MLVEGHQARPGPGAAAERRGRQAGAALGRSSAQAGTIRRPAAAGQV